MKTREKIFQKINVEIEMLSDDELEQVSGGYINQTTGDSEILYDYGLMDKYFTTVPMTLYWKSKSAEVDAGWAKAGITCCTSPCGANKYWHNGKEISRDEAHAHLKANFKRLHNVSGD